MDIELTDEQGWLSESIDALLQSAWPRAEEHTPPDAAARDRLWSALSEFGALSVGGDDGLGAIELCLIGRALGRHLATAPFLGSSAARFALLDAPGDLSELLGAGRSAVALALLEPGSGWDLATPATRLGDGEPARLTGRKTAVEQLGAADELLVVTSTDAGRALALVPATTAGVQTEGRPAFDGSIPLSAVRLDGVAVPAERVLRGADADVALDRLLAVAALLAAAEAVGAAERLLELARDYAAERRQFGQTIGSFQALRHILADMHVRQQSSWSTVLYAAATLDDPGEEEPLRTASIAKAWSSRATLEAAHGALQVFGGVAFTAEHPAHRFLRRVVVRGQQFGDAAHHERVLGRALVAA